MLTECQTLDDYLAAFGGMLGDQAKRSLAPLHVPGRDQPNLPRFLRPLFDAQAHVVAATVKALHRQNAVWIVGEMGVGKTIIGMAAAHAHAAGEPYRGIVFCPGQLVHKWERELRETIAGITVTHIESVGDLLPLRRGDRPSCPHWFIVGRDRAKLGPLWEPAFLPPQASLQIASCPSCGLPILDKNGNAIGTERLGRMKHACLNCNSPLWTYTGRPRRWSPAKYINRRLKGFFDYAIIDEVHEEKSADSAQATAAGRIVSASRKTIALTGTLIGGRADHLRPIMFRLAAKSLVAEGLRFNESMPFNELYGRVETRITEKDKPAGPDNLQSDGRSISRTKFVRPGVMPSLFGRHLIDKAVFLPLEDVAANLPPLVESVIPVTMDHEQADAYKDLEADLMAAVREMVSRGDMRLLGMMLTALLSYPDHPFGWGEIGYWEGDRHVCVHEPPDLSTLINRPKEMALLNAVRAERAEGRQCWVYCQMTGVRDVLGRLGNMLACDGMRVKILRSAEVDVADRESWIEANGRDADVILSNPKLVETGLDLFCKAGGHNFATLIHYQTGYNLFTLRQASRRAWRIGQLKECRVKYLFYEGTMQARAMTLMGRKMLASQAIEGRFSSEGLAAMAGEEDSMEMALARSLVGRLSDLDAGRVWNRIGSPAKKPASAARTSTAALASQLTLF